MKRLSAAVLLLMAVLAGPAFGAGEFFKKFQDDYNQLGIDLLNHMGEYGQIQNFVYTKDVATFTFKEGIIHFLRYVNDRPTTALFIGKGHASIRIPSHVERQSLLALSHDSLVEQDFETCFIRLGDDFDLKVKERFSLEPKQLSWKDFNLASKKDQGEFFFKPIIQHRYDNYFELLRSIYERGSDGYFWIDFNRYVFTYDPNRPEQVVVAYEFEGGDLVATEAAVFQRESAAVYADSAMSQIVFPTTILDRTAKIEMGGMDGKRLEGAETTVQIRINDDSLKYVSLFLDHNLIVDSVALGQEPIDFSRRKDFDFLGLILPEYYYRENVISLTLWYHGKQFDDLMPWVEDPQASTYSWEVTVPKGFNYFVPDMGPVSEVNGKWHFEVKPSNPFRAIYFDCYVSGLDTLPHETDLGLTLNYLIWDLMSKKYSECFIPHEMYQPAVLSAFNYMTSVFGGPPGSFEVWACPGATHSMPGIMAIPQIACVTKGPMLAFGGFNAVAGAGVARQWFGPLMQPASYRELWITDAAAEYANILYLQSSLGSAAYSNLLNRRDTVYTNSQNNRDLPLAVGDRCRTSSRVNKGLWVLHMLRMMMYDLDSGSDAAFLRFMYELAQMTNSRKFTNEDIIHLAEKHTGHNLDQFFAHWLYDYGMPQYEGTYQVVNEGGQYYIDLTVKIKNVDSTFAESVIMRSVGADGSTAFVRQIIKAPNDQVRLGPFAFEPVDLVFNEFYSVLCMGSVSKK